VARPNTQDPDDNDNDPGTDTRSGTCMACRGTGRLISGLGGTPHEVTCPWCRGTGNRIPGIDAQESPAETAPSAGAE
jgi:DnaJ-class molecular chaperone